MCGFSLWCIGHFWFGTKSERSWWLMGMVCFEFYILEVVVVWVLGWFEKRVCCGCGWWFLGVGLVWETCVLWLWVVVFGCGKVVLVLSFLLLGVFLGLEVFGFCSFCVGFLSLFLLGWSGGVFSFVSKEVSSMLVLVFFIFVVGLVCVMSMSFWLKLISLGSVVFFVSGQLVWLYVSFEFCLVPIMMVVFVWGSQPERLGAMYYLLFYALVSAFPFVLVLCFLGMGISLFILSGTSGVLFWALLVGFLVKMPLYGFHLWLPKAHVEAPSLGSVILAGLLLKLGSFGLCRLLFVSFSFYFFLFGLVSMVGMVLSGVLCCFQSDGKSLVAFSSVCHMNFMVVVLLLYYGSGKSASFLMMLSHGVVASVMFWVIGFLFHSFYSRSLYWLRGVVSVSGVFGLMVVGVLFANFGVPPMLSFFQEVLFISGFVGGVYVGGGLLFVYMLLVCYYNVFLYVSVFGGKGGLVSVAVLDCGLLFFSLVLLFNLVFLRLLF